MLELNKIRMAQRRFNDLLQQLTIHFMQLSKKKGDRSRTLLLTRIKP